MNALIVDNYDVQGETVCGSRTAGMGKDAA